MAKTKSYTKKAVDNYRSKHDFLNLTLPMGTKERIKDLGYKTADISKMVLRWLDSEEEKRNDLDWTPFE